MSPIKGLLECETDWSSTMRCDIADSVSVGGGMIGGGIYNVWPFAQLVAYVCIYWLSVLFVGGFVSYRHLPFNWISGFTPNTISFWMSLLSTSVDPPSNTPAFLNSPHMCLTLNALSTSGICCSSVIGILRLSPIRSYPIRKSLIG